MVNTHPCRCRFSVSLPAKRPAATAFPHPTHPAGEAEGTEFLTTRAPWKCTVCNVTCTSQDTLLGHAAGAKHKRRVSGHLPTPPGGCCRPTGGTRGKPCRRVCLGGTRPLDAPFGCRPSGDALAGARHPTLLRNQCTPLPPLAPWLGPAEGLQPALQSHVSNRPRLQSVVASWRVPAVPAPVWLLCSHWSKLLPALPCVLQAKAALAAQNGGQQHTAAEEQPAGQQEEQEQEQQQPQAEPAATPTAEVRQDGGGKREKKQKKKKQKKGQEDSQEKMKRPKNKEKYNKNKEKYMKLQGADAAENGGTAAGDGSAVTSKEARKKLRKKEKMMRKQQQKEAATAAAAEAPAVLAAAQHGAAATNGQGKKAEKKQKKRKEKEAKAAGAANEGAAPGSGKKEGKKRKAEEALAVRDGPGWLQHQVPAWVVAGLRVHTWA